MTMNIKDDLRNRTFTLGDIVGLGSIPDAFAAQGVIVGTVSMMQWTDIRFIVSFTTGVDSIPQERIFYRYQIHHSIVSNKDIEAILPANVDIPNDEVPF